jgi:hypothetical protein
MPTPVIAGIEKMEAALVQLAVLQPCARPGWPLSGPGCDRTTAP